MKVQSTIEIRFRDIDSMGHVNNAVYLSYFEQARMAYFKELVGGDWDWNNNGILIAKHEIEYKLPVLLNDSVYVETWCESIGNSSLVMAYKVFKSESILCTTGKTVLVCFDYKSEATTSVPQEWRDKIAIVP